MISARPDARDAGTVPRPADMARLRVLVADDDEPVQRAMKLLFERLGHGAEVVGSGEAALERLARGDAVDLLVLDVNMPGLGGAATLQRVRAMRPDLPVLLCTGLADERAIEVSRSFPAVGLLPKPFDAKELAAALRQFRFTRA
ncbi:MAG: response regulator [Vicinamibacteria bacterium]|jgi:CheY-like chemotaxis protein|nr:response regulator [Vicinamibacteria bacterium]